jgi:metal-responsive CopG/Arc/MetJ family transcriptional regulator
MIRSMRKIKLSITLPADLVDRIDAAAQRQDRANRSAVIEQWLRRGARARALDALHEETLAYYTSRDGEDVAEDERLGRALGQAARKVQYDD